MTDSMEDKIDNLIGAVKSGVNLMTACHYSGLSTHLVFQWMERGRIEEERLNANPKLKPKKSEEGFLEIWVDLKKANASNTARMEQVIIRAAEEGEWKAAAWYLERRLPETYGKSVTERKPHNLEATPLPAELEV